MSKKVLSIFAVMGLFLAFANIAYAKPADEMELIECEPENVSIVDFYLEKDAEEEYYTAYAVDGVISADVKSTIDAMAAYLKSVNPNVEQSVIDMLPYYIIEGKLEGIRGEIAFAQSCLETGNFAFRGSAVTLDQNNFCGLGVTRNGMEGNSFDTPQLGIRAQIQHLKAYASEEELVLECIDPRFHYVARGCAPYVEWLGIQENPQGKGWASGAGYGDKILRILSRIEEEKVVEVPQGSDDESDEDETEEHVDMPDSPEREGLIFAGWVDEKSKILSEKYVVEEDTRLCAVWYVGAEEE